MSLAIDEEFYRRFHRDLLSPHNNNKSKSPYHQLNQLEAAAGYLKSPQKENEPPNLEHVIGNLRDEKRQLDAWKAAKLPYTATSVHHRDTHQGRQSSLNDYDNDAAAEIQRLKNQLLRYQEADPQADFVHKDVLQLVVDELERERQNCSTATAERDAMLRNLEASKWTNSKLISEKESIARDLGDIQSELAKANNTIQEKEKECEQQNRVISTLENQLQEFQRRYQTLDNHLMELGEQKTAFLEGLRERQSQLDFCMAQLQATQERLVKADKERDVMKRQMEELQRIFNQIKQELQNEKESHRATQHQLNSVTTSLKNAELNVAKQKEIILTFERQNNNQQVLLEKMASTLATTTDNFEKFVQEVQQKEHAWSLETQKALNELQELKSVSQNMTFGQVTSSPMGSMMGNIGKADQDYHGLMEKTKQREVEFKTAVDNALNEIKTLRKDVEAKQRDLQHLTTTNKTYESTIKAQKEEINILMEKLKEAQAKLKDCEKKIEELTNENASLSKEREDLLVEKAELQNNIKQLENNLKEKTRDLKVAQVGKRMAEKTANDRSAAVGWATDEPQTKQLNMLKKGFVVKKLSYASKNPFGKKHKPNDRYIRLHSNGIHLEMWKGLSPAGKPTKTISLPLILRTEYGENSTATVWQSKMVNRMSKTLKKRVFFDEQQENPVPWRCFSLFTADRSYDFECKDDATAEALVVGIGTALKPLGIVSIKSRHECIFRRVQMKLKGYCQRRDITVKQLLLEAIHRYIMTTPGLAATLHKNGGRNKSVKTVGPTLKPKQTLKKFVDSSKTLVSATSKKEPVKKLSTTERTSEGAKEISKTIEPQKTEKALASTKAEPAKLTTSKSSTKVEAAKPTPSKSASAKVETAKPAEVETAKSTASKSSATKVEGTKFAAPKPSTAKVETAKPAASKSSATKVEVTKLAASKSSVETEVAKEVSKVAAKPSTKLNALMSSKPLSKTDTQVPKLFKEQEKAFDKAKKLTSTKPAIKPAQELKKQEAAESKVISDKVSEGSTIMKKKDEQVSLETSTAKPGLEKKNESLKKLNISIVSNKKSLQKTSSSLLKEKPEFSGTKVGKKGVVKKTGIKDEAPLKKKSLLKISSVAKEPLLSAKSKMLKKALPSSAKTKVLSNTKQLQKKK